MIYSRREMKQRFYYTFPYVILIFFNNFVLQPNNIA